jgi:hypothetical protein
MCQYSKAAIAQKRSAHINCPHHRVFKTSQRLSHPKVSSVHLSRIRWQFVIYFCLHRGSLPENTAGRQRRFRGQNPLPRQNQYSYMSYITDEKRESRQRGLKRINLVETSAMKKRSIQLRDPAASMRIRSGFAFLSVCVLVGLVAFFAGAHAQVATPIPAATATPAPTATPFPPFAPGRTPPRP